MIEGGFGASILMLEQVREALDAGRLARLTPDLPPMKRIIARARSAPRGTEVLEQSLVRALRAVAN
jgi:hypothetical protein